MSCRAGTLTSLEEAAEDFAQELTQTFAGVLGSGVPAFVAERAPTLAANEVLTRVLAVSYTHLTLPTTPYV